jgi:hypothetical protein
MGVGAAACGQSPSPCTGKPDRPSVIRTAAFFGPVTSDLSGWTFESSPKTAEVTVSGRRVTVNPRTEFLGYCGPGVPACYAFVGSAAHGIATWVLFAKIPDPARAGTAGRRLIVDGVTVWRVKEHSVVLSQGVELPFGAVFQKRLDATYANTKFRTALEQDSVGAELTVDAATGEVVDAGINGCA